MTRIFREITCFISKSKLTSLYYELQRYILQHTS